jgi:hypothetical protein
LARVQKDYRLLQTAQNRIKNRANVTSSSSRTQRSLYDDLNSLQLMALDFDIEKYRIYIQQGKLKLSQLQSQVDASKKTIQQRGVFGAVKKNAAKEIQEQPTEQITTEENDWISQLDFSEIRDDAQKRLFIQHMERRLWPRNEEIRKSFERSIINSNNFMQLYWNVDYWRDWYQMRQTHEYAQILRNKFIHDGAPLNDTLLDVKKIPRMKRKRSTDPFFFNEEDIPTIGDSWIMNGSNDQVQWRDQLYHYIYRRPEHDHVPVIDGMQIRSDHKSWKSVYRTRKDLFNTLHAKYIHNDSVDVNDYYNKYVYALCRISTRRDVTSNILAKYLSYKPNRRRVPVHETRSIEPQSQTIPVREYESSRDELLMILREQQQKRQEIYTKAVLSSVISSWLARHIKRYLNICNNDPIRFYERAATISPNDTLQKSCVDFVILLKKQYGSDVQAIKFNAGLVTNLLKQRLFTDQGTFWSELFSYLSNNTPGSKDLIIAIVRYQIEVY